MEAEDMHYDTEKTQTGNMADKLLNVKRMSVVRPFVQSQYVCVHNCRSFDLVQWVGFALPVSEGWNGVWAAEGKPPVDPEWLVNASKWAKSAFALVLDADDGVRMRFRQTRKKKRQTKNKWLDKNRMSLYLWQKAWTSTQMQWVPYSIWKIRTPSCFKKCMLT